MKIRIKKDPLIGGHTFRIGDTFEVVDFDKRVFERVSKDKYWIHHKDNFGSTDRVALFREEFEIIEGSTDDLL